MSHGGNDIICKIIGLFDWSRHTKRGRRNRSAGNAQQKCVQ